MADFFGVNLETPQEAQQRLRGEALTQLQQFKGNTNAQAGFLLGKGIGAAFNKFRKKESKDVATARQNEEATEAFNETFTSETGSGTDANVAQRRALARAIAKLRVNGNEKAAQQLTTQLVGMTQAAEVRDLQLRKLKADVVTAEAPTPPKDELTRLENERDSLSTRLAANTGGPNEQSALKRRIANIDKLIKKKTTIVGRTDVDAQALGLTKPVNTDLQERIINSGTQLTDIRGLAVDFRPEFLQFSGQIAAGSIALAEKAGLPIPDGAQEFLTDYTSFKGKTSRQLNAYIKAITGAQMSEPEAKRLTAAVANLSNSPTEFRVQMIDIYRQLDAANRRASHAVAEGNVTEFSQVEEFGATESFARSREEIETELFNPLSAEDQALLESVLNPPEQ